MIDMYSKYDNMHTNRIFNALNCVSNHINLCINCMLLVVPSQLMFSHVSVCACVGACARVCVRVIHRLKHPLQILANPLYSYTLYTR